LFTLNHDLVLEHALRERGIAFSDGFSGSHGSLMLWNDSYPAATCRLFKLHGSVNWFRFRIREAGVERQVIARAEADVLHAIGPNVERLDVPLDARPEFLVGTFNKILGYASGIYADQHFRFHEALSDADRLLVVGYGFRDKAINARVVAWLNEGRRRRLVVVHRQPTQLLGQGARGAIRGNWRSWLDHGNLAFVESHLGSDADSPAFRAALASET
jgi:hypothetical protein